MFINKGFWKIRCQSQEKDFKNKNINYIIKEINERREYVMEKKIILNSEKVPAAIGPYSPAVKIGKLMFISGQLPVNPENGNLIKGDIKEQTVQILKNLSALLDLYSLTLKNVVKTTVFLKDMNNFSEFNKAYAQYFKEEFPARSCVEVARLPKDAEIEIEAIVVCD
mgnify:CR=1 FL=1